MESRWNPLGSGCCREQSQSPEVSSIQRRKGRGISSTEHWKGMEKGSVENQKNGVSWQMKEEKFKKQGLDIYAKHCWVKDEKGPLDLAIWRLLVTSTRLENLKGRWESFEEYCMKGSEEWAVDRMWCGAKENLTRGIPDYDYKLAGLTQ